MMLNSFRKSSSSFNAPLLQVEQAGTVTRLLGWGGMRPGTRLKDLVVSVTTWPVSKEACPNSSSGGHQAGKSSLG
jgi:hypothetical protein